MKIVGLMPVRNEDWILGLSARAALMWVNDLIILDHCSKDGTRQIWADILSEFAGRSGVLVVDSPEWSEMQHRQKLLECARNEDATHIAMIDADEILCGHCLPTIRQQIEKLPDCGMLRAHLFNMRETHTKLHINGLWGDRDVALAFKDNANAHWSGDKFHHREPAGITWRPFADRQFGVMHLWAVDERRARAKQALYKLTERLRWPKKSVQWIDSYYSQAIYPKAQHEQFTVKKWEYTEAPAEWWDPYAHLMHHLHVDREPWQIAECKRLVKENPGIERGLDLFGVV